MKSKTIKKILKLKIDDWIKSIKDSDVRDLVRKNTIVTGGSIASLLLKEKVNDYDVYFKNKETVLAVANYYVEEFNKSHQVGAKVLDGKDVENMEPERVKIYIKSRGVAGTLPEVTEGPIENAVEHLDDIDPDILDPKPEDRYKPVFLSSNAITLSGRIQIVIRFYGDAETLHENYDFVHCTNYYDHGKDELVLQPKALESLLAKELVYVGSKYPLCSIIRTRKFLTRGFTINAGQYVKMCLQVSKLDLQDVNVLEDQLVGVDSSYFTMIIEAIKSKMESDPSFKFDDSYLISIIDKVF